MPLFSERRSDCIFPHCKKARNKKTFHVCIRFMKREGEGELLLSLLSYLLGEKGGELIIIRRGGEFFPLFSFAFNMNENRP